MIYLSLYVEVSLVFLMVKNRIVLRNLFWAYVIGAMGSFCDEASARNIEQFFKAHPVPAADRTLQQSLERIRSCGALKTAQQGKLAEWLSHQQ